MTDSCSTCFFGRTFNVIKGGNTSPVFVCARNAPKSGSDIQQAATLWPEIKDPSNWWCGDFLQNYPATSVVFSDWTPTISTNTGTLTSSSLRYARFVTLGKLIVAQMMLHITTNGTGGTTVNFTLPTAPAAGGGGAQVAQVFGLQNPSHKTLVGVTGGAGSAGVGLTFYDGTYPGADNTDISATTIYETS